ncbi:MAG TPA: hypothetical protein VNF47_20125 [Streptosporangiaceae bacterium]|nr:hypothetical protein [Streptosporangiaceae bacterium]
MPNLIDKLPAALGNRLRSRAGTQFLKFALVAAAALATSEIALTVFVGAVHLTGGLAGVSASMLGALVSYVLSRWAWERKGRPDLLRETLPFWIISLGAWFVLGLATKLGIHLAISLGALGTKKLAIVDSVYFLANCLVFVVRFVILHYVLFADRGARAAGPVEAESLTPVAVAVPTADEQDNQPEQ